MPQDIAGALLAQSAEAIDPKRAADAALILDAFARAVRERQRAVKRLDGKLVETYGSMEEVRAELRRKRDRCSEVKAWILFTRSYGQYGQGERALMTVVNGSFYVGAGVALFCDAEGQNSIGLPARKRPFTWEGQRLWPRGGLRNWLRG
jgi:hypothetical protein